MKHYSFSQCNQFKQRILHTNSSILFTGIYSELCKKQHKREHVLFVSSKVALTVCQVCSKHALAFSRGLNEKLLRVSGDKRCIYFCLIVNYVFCSGERSGSTRQQDNRNSQGVGSDKGCPENLLVHQVETVYICSQIIEDHQNFIHILHH